MIKNYFFFYCILNCYFKRRFIMEKPYEFFKSIINTLSENIVVIDNKGDIKFVNSSWINFAKGNNCLIADNWDDVNYLKVCDKSASKGDKYGLNVARGIREIINKERDSFYFEYPCHSPIEKRWFMMRITSFVINEDFYYVISHQNITERKFAEEQVLHLSRIDSLTNLANRRYFDDFLNKEWRRSARLKQPISLAIIDIDHFKLLNDTYGHQVGDESLKKIAEVLQHFTKRSSDLSARYGGEEFALILGNTTSDDALVLLNTLIQRIRSLKIPNKNSPIKKYVTVSIGLSTMYPHTNINNEKDLIKFSDLGLYQAKENGRDKIVFEMI